GVLPEAAADGNEQSPERDVVGHAREADGAEEDGVVAADPIEAVVRHHPAVAGEVLAAPGVLVPVELDAVLAAGGLEDALAFRDDFLADAVARDHCDAVGGHALTLQLRKMQRRPFWRRLAATS